MIAGLNHITLAIRNLDESLRFYQDVLGLQAMARWPKGAYLTAGDLWLVLIEDDQCRHGSLPEYTPALHKSRACPENQAAFSRAER